MGINSNLFSRWYVLTRKCTCGFDVTLVCIIYYLSYIASMHSSDQIKACGQLEPIELQSNSTIYPSMGKIRKLYMSGAFVYKSNPVPFGFETSIKQHIFFTARSCNFRDLRIHQKNSWTQTMATLRPWWTVFTLHGSNVPLITTMWLRLFRGNETRSREAEGDFLGIRLCFMFVPTLCGTMIFLFYKRDKFLDNTILQVLFFDLLFWKGYWSILIC